MKLLGLVGGVSPESTEIYYRLLNDAARKKCGGQHSANLIVYTLDYGVMIKHYDNRDWDQFRAEVVRGAKAVAAAGAEALVICSNTTHVGAKASAEATGLPVIHILDTLVAEMQRRSVEKPLLLGTPVVMAEGFYRDELAKRFSGDVTVPSAEDREIVGRIILEELVEGVVRDASRQELLDVCERSGGDGVILGCTELCMILSQDHLSQPVLDTTSIHAQAASAFAFGEG
ncbi:aspartate/glutamate racemase family protein [Hyphococcus sp. DH-69]|uniref:aspartate/glutamate racemase family protein n=1 Tax=Hyphococcus formosus TaxID=3143534 RepID=UPI00398AA4EA